MHTSAKIIDLINDKSYIPSTLLLVKPIDFAFNEDTALDNAFQNRSDLNQETISKNAIYEFNELVSLLQHKGINIIIHDKSKYPELSKYYTPDACFPNNWLSTDINGYLYTYPMFASNRKLEKLAFPYIEKQLWDAGFDIKGTINIGSIMDQNRILEGTGSMIFDRQNKVIYATISQRTNENAFKEYCKLTGYEGILFKSQSNDGKPYYHTNMIMCIGDSFAIICKECIHEDDKEKVMLKLHESKKEIIEITREQVEKYNCGNILQAYEDYDNEDGSTQMKKKYILMSNKAYMGYNQIQKENLEKFGQIIKANIETIENIGGGSVRCMLCEIYLPKRK